jgi:hypothetical protein
VGDRLAAVAVAVPFLLGALSGPAEARAEEEFRFQDPEIVESSGLVVDGDAFATVNDSGDTGRVFVVDGDNGETVGEVTWAAEPEDVEALAPAGPGHVWVGDIGDNGRSRTTIEVARVRLGVGSRTVVPEVFSLVYPDGPADAETLLRHPRTGRLYVVSKVFFGGTLYAAPATLQPDAPNRLREVGGVLSLATDGAFFPDGRHLLLRDYGGAVVYSWPELERVAEVGLPDQEQGEGLAIDDDGEVYVSTEGQKAPVHRVPLPAQVRALVDGTAEPKDGPSAEPDPTLAPDAADDDPLPESWARERPVWPWFLTGWLGLGALVGLTWFLRRRP